MRKEQHAPSPSCRQLREQKRKPMQGAPDSRVSQAAEAAAQTMGKAAGGGSVSPLGPSREVGETKSATGWALHYLSQCHTCKTGG